jgi:hypothetical protein
MPARDQILLSGFVRGTEAKDDSSARS